MSKFEESLKEEDVMQNEKNKDVEKSKNLKCVLKQIFLNTPEDRLVQIENILKKEQIYSGSDMELVDTNDLREKKSLSNIEILKIEEYIKQNYRERYDDIKSVKMAEDKKIFAKLKGNDDIELLKLKQMEEIKYMQLKGQEKQKMNKFKAEEEQRLRNKDKELMEAKANVMKGENMKMQREKEIKEERTIEEDMMHMQIKLIESNEERKKINLQRKVSMQEKMESKKNNERKTEIRDVNTIEDMERTKNVMKIEQAKIEAEMAKEKFKLQRDLANKRFDLFISEKKALMEDVQELGIELIQFRKVIAENSHKGVLGYFKNNSIEKKKAEIELEERKKMLKSKNERITEINKLLQDAVRF